MGRQRFFVTAPPVPGSGRRGAAPLPCPARGLGGDRRIEYSGEPQGLLVCKILFTLLFHNSPPICRPG